MSFSSEFDSLVHASSCHRLGFCVVDVVSSIKNYNIGQEARQQDLTTNDIIQCFKKYLFIVCTTDSVCDVETHQLHYFNEHRYGAAITMRFQGNRLYFCERCMIIM